MKIKWIFLTIWILSILAFVIGQFLAPQDYASLPNNPWENLFGTSFVLGVISFILMLIFIVVGKKNKEPNESSKRRGSFVKFLLFVWLFCLFGFGISVLVATNFFRSTGTGTILGSSLLYIILLVVFGGIGTVSFGLMALLIIINAFSENKILEYREPSNAIVSIIKISFILAFLPLWLIYKASNIEKLFGHIRKEGFKTSMLRPKSFKSFIKRFVSVIVVSLVFIPIWVGGYWLVGTITAERLGYVAEDVNIVGTGSMYPTWPKGTAGKDPKELAKEVISKAGFLPYPNGLVLKGKRIFGHVLERGDIIIWIDDATKDLTSQNGGEATGLIKRLIGLPGDKIELRDGIVYLNSEPQKEPYIAKPRSTYGEKFLKECQVITVPEGEVFAMGDNRKGSADSREIGFVPIKDVSRVLPLSKQKGTLDKNWHDASNDLIDSTKPKIDKVKFVELLNEKRKEKGVSILKHNLKLEKSAYLRGEAILKYNDFEQKSSYTMEKSMADAGYWNTYWWEMPIQGYYEADELIENFLDRNWSSGKETWFDKKFDDIGIAEVEGELNGCPTQVIVIHIAGYIPATYEKGVVDSWKTSLASLKGIQSGWQGLKNNSSFYEKNKGDIDRINEIISIRISNISIIVSKMEARQWFTSAEQKMIDSDQALYNEQEAIATRLNSK